MKTISEQLSEMRQYVSEHLAECCIECLEWENAGTLKDGYMRQAAKFLIDPAFEHHHLTHVSNYVKQCAMERIALFSKQA